MAAGRSAPLPQHPADKRKAADNDNRKNMPRFQAEHYDANMQRAEAIKALAAKKGCTGPQLALAWLLDQGTDIVPIPGTKRRKYLAENIAAVSILLTDEDRHALAHTLPPVSGPRYGEAAMKLIDRG